MRFLDRLEEKLGRFAIGQLHWYIAGLSLVVFSIYKAINPDIFFMIRLDPALVMRGEVWRLVTYWFIPQFGSLIPSPDWLNVVFYAIFIVFIGNGLEQVWGAFRFNLYCLLCAVGITIPAFIYGSAYAQLMFVDALFFAFARYYGEAMIQAFYVIPIKVKWAAWLNLFWLFYLFLSGGMDYRVSMLSALACYAIFFWPEMFAQARLEKTSTARRAKFDRQTEEAKRESLHKCAICGRTELESPELDFRVAKDGNEYCREHLPKSAPAAT